LDDNELPLERLSKSSAPKQLPEIKLGSRTHTFRFDNLVFCHTPAETPFITIIDICLDHLKGAGITYIEKLFNKTPEIAKQEIYH
jgi:hypothetical protein